MIRLKIHVFILTSMLLGSTLAIAANNDAPGFVKVSDGSGQASAGLKEALTNAAEGAVKLTGRPGGYSDNPAIKILLPKSFQPVEKGLRAVGYGPQLDKFVESMN
ncbi:MAG TPA: DUF4197 family protein, partial [Candidatus Binataceae bacterium]|nr:DUF4197 family protein [Candidatus Binataceae bacterium]